MSLNDTQIYNGDDHKTFGPPEPHDTPLDIDEMRNELSTGCKHKVDGECHFDPEDWSDYCMSKNSCPVNRW
jgi:hypothetical protein